MTDVSAVSAGAPLAPAFATLVDLLRERARATPERLAFTYLEGGERETDAITYAGLDQKARAIAAYLQRQGFAGERALMLLPSGIDFVAAFFGCLYAAVVPVPAPLPERTLLPNLDHAAALGVDPGDLTSTLGVLMGGVEAPGDEELGSRYVVYLRANERFRTDPSLLGLITVPSRTLGLVPLTDVVTQAEGTGPSQITRTARAKSITIIANVAPGHAEGEIVAALDAAIKELNLPPGYTAGPFGRSKEMARTGKAFMFAFLLSFLFMYLVLAAQFESWIHPVTILISLPLSVPFALFSLVTLRQSMNIFSTLGILVLFGIVKKNSILQVDHMRDLRRHGLGRALTLSSRVSFEGPRWDRHDSNADTSPQNQTDPALLWDIVLSGQEQRAGLRIRLVRRAAPLPLLPLADVIVSVLPLGMTFGRAACAIARVLNGCRTRLSAAHISTLP